MQDHSHPAADLPERILQIVARYSGGYEPTNRIGRLWSREPKTGNQQDGPEETQTRHSFADEVRSANFDASHLQQVVERIRSIEEGLKTLIAARTRKIVEEKVSVERQRPVPYGFIRRALLAMGAIGQKLETYTDVEIRQKEVPREPDEVAISEFRTMIDRYLESLADLNRGLRKTVEEVDLIVRNLTTVSDAYTDQIHRDRRAFFGQIRRSRELSEQLAAVSGVYESLSPLDERYPAVEKARDHLEMALRDSQGMELKYKTSIDMSVNYQNALKSYRRLINDFRERGDIHVTLVDQFAQGAGHLKIAVDNVSQICSGVARVTQSMIMIVESIEGGNKVLGRYAALIGEGAAQAPQWEMQYEELLAAEAVYLQNDRLRLRQLEGNRKEIESLLTGCPRLTGDDCRA